MKYILNVPLDDYILACRAIKSHIEHDPNNKSSITVFENGKEYVVIKNKASYTVRENKWP